MRELEQDIQRARKRLGQNVRKARAAEGLSLADVAERTGETEQRLAQIEAGECDVPFDTLVHRARTLHTTLSALFTP